MRTSWHKPRRATRVLVAPAIFPGRPPRRRHGPPKLRRNLLRRVAGTRRFAEREVLQLLAESKTNKEIAGVLNLSVHTVEAHRGRIMEKLPLHSIGKLVLFAVRSGLIE